MMRERSRRRVLPLLLVTIGVGVLDVGAALSAASRLDRPHAGKLRVSDRSPLDDCAMFELFDQVARVANVPLGFENVLGCGFGQRTALAIDRTTLLVASTPREAFDEVAALSGHFRWEEIDGMAVVRPSSAWHERDNLLNLPAHSFQLMNVDARDALYRVLDAATPNVGYEVSRKQASGVLDAPVSVDFGGGNLLRALNAIVRAKGDAEWRVGYSKGEAAILIGRLSKLNEPAVGYVSRIVWKAPGAGGAIVEP